MTCAGGGCKNAIKKCKSIKGCSTVDLNVDKSIATLKLAFQWGEKLTRQFHKVRNSNTLLSGPKPSDLKSECMALTATARRPGYAGDQCENEEETFCHI